jgi:hypothetical protein
MIHFLIKQMSNQTFAYEPFFPLKAVHASNPNLLPLESKWGVELLPLMCFLNLVDV